MVPSDIADANETYEENPDHVEEVARELYWREFEGTLREAMLERNVPYVLRDVAWVMRHGPDEGDVLNCAMADFADAEGWPNVLRALARAMEQS